MRVGILVNETKPQALELKAGLMGWLENKGVEVVCPGDIYCLESTGMEDVRDSFRGLDLILVLGGDGTLIHASLVLAGLEVPLLGINLGHLGFLTSLEMDNLHEGLERFMAGEYRVEERMMLDVSLVREGEVLEEYLALNDAVVSKDAFARMVDIEIRIDGQKVDRYSADGLIIATPTGSTAYSLSAGGPIVVPSFSAMILTPICAHTLYSRPMVIPADALVEVELTKSSSEVMLTSDGQTGVRMRVGDSVRVRKSDRSVRFVKFGDRSFFDVLHEKLSSGGRNA